jgi:hypothetical protein
MALGREMDDGVVAGEGGGERRRLADVGVDEGEARSSMSRIVERFPA